MIRVMVVDDSPLVRKIASDILNGAPGIEVVATAATAEFALSKLERERPDVITMDMEMPGMGGLEAIREVMAKRPTAIIVLSAHARKGAELTLQALEAGAVDFVLKPSASLSGGLDEVARRLIEAVRCAVGAPPPKPVVREEPVAAKSVRAAAPLPPLPGGRYRIAAIGTSTGGPVALKVVLSGLPADFPLPVVVVQHMPPVFTKAFAERLDSTCSVSVKEAEDGDELVAGRVLIAPGDFHMTVVGSGSSPHVRLNQTEQVSGHRPSVDVLMHSVAREYGSRAIGVIMTGMGKDGADGLRELHERQGVVLAQDKDSSVIFGMNAEVIRNGNADRVVPVQGIAANLIECVRAGN